MKRNLLELVQSILSDMDSEDVNAIADSVEAQQIASVIEDTYYNLIASKVVPEHKGLLKLTSLSDSSLPTHFKYPAETKQLDTLSYNVDAGGVDFNYREVKFVEPSVFLSRATKQDNTLAVLDVNGGTTFYVKNDEFPSYYTSFDDEHIVMNAYDATVEATLTEARSRAYGSKYPTFTISDTFEPDLDDTLRPYLLAEAKSTCFSLFKAGTDPKIEQAAMRHKYYVQSNMYKSEKGNTRPTYGRG